MYYKNVLGKPLRIHQAERKSTSAPVPIPTLAWGDLTMSLDRQNMQPCLARLIPGGYLTNTVTGTDWEPFIRLAFAMGLLR